jgi:CRISPR-associated protein Csm3
MKRTRIYQITGEIVTRSGLHVGGSDDELEIGGVDLPVIKTPETEVPYIPGSSLKGRMRSELERVHGKYSNDNREPCNCCATNCPVCRVFGPHKYKPRKKDVNGRSVEDVSNHPGPTRLLVRDAYASGPVATELKTENVIDRHTGQAAHPRKYERVPPGVHFPFRLTLQVMDVDASFTYKDRNGKDHKAGDALLSVVCDCLYYVEQTGVGGSLSRGSGEVQFEGLKLDDAEWKCN